MKYKYNKNRLFTAAITTAIAILVLSSSIYGQQQASKLDKLNFLLGEWVGEGGGTPGQGTGGFTFNYNLQNTIIERHSYAEYPATAEKAAYRHDDLIIIYHSPDDTIRANYYDNEGHVIDYTVNVDTLQKTVVFVSPQSLAAPRYRLTYDLIKTDTVSIKFEIAPPGQPDAFTTYIKAAAHKK